MEESIIPLTIIALELSIFWFVYVWFDDIWLWYNDIIIGLYVAGAVILLISTFGTYESTITYKLPNEDEIRELIIKLP